jgi:hypothetical protein
VLPFRPDAVLYTAHARDTARIVYWLITAHQRGVKFGDPYLENLATQLGIDEKTPEPLLRKRLNPHAEELLAWTYRRIVEICRKNNIPCYFIMLPMLDVHEDETNMRLAKEAGFIVLDALDAYEGQPISSLKSVEWDGHPNAVGHKLLAGKVFELIRDGVIPKQIHKPDSGGQAAKKD